MAVTYSKCLTERCFLGVVTGEGVLALVSLLSFSWHVVCLDSVGLIGLNHTCYLQMRE